MGEDKITSGGGPYLFDIGSSFNPITSPQTPLPIFSNDSLSTSSDAVAIATLTASSPVLPQIDATVVLMEAERKKQEIISKMLDDWNTQLQMEKDRRERELNSANYRAKQDIDSADGIAKRDLKAHLIEKANSPDESVYISGLPISPLVPYQLDPSYTWHASISAGLTALSPADASKNLSVANTTAAASLSNSEAFHSIAFLTPAMILGVTSIPLFQGASVINSSMQVQSKLYQEAWAALTPGADDIATKVGGWFSALWGVGLLYRVSADNLSVSNKGLKVPHDMDFAKQHAVTLMTTLSDPSFSKAIKAMMKESAKIQSSPLSDQDANLLQVKGKIVLLSMALALIAKLEVGSKLDEGWISELDFQGLINNTTDIKKDDIHNTSGIKETLITQINSLFDEIPAQSAQLKSNLLAYMSTNPSIEDLLDHQEVFHSVFRSHSLDGESLNQTAV